MASSNRASQLPIPEISGRHAWSGQVGDRGAHSCLALGCGQLLIVQVVLCQAAADVRTATPAADPGVIGLPTMGSGGDLCAGH